MPRCVGKTVDGGQCKRDAAEGSKKCYQHKATKGGKKAVGGQCPMKLGGKKEKGEGGDSLYDRLGGAFVIARVVNYFSNEMLRSPKVGINSPNPKLKEWATTKVKERMPGLKFMRSLWVCTATGGPQQYAGTKPGKNQMDLSEAHKEFNITSEEFDEVVGILAKSLDHFGVGEKEKKEVLDAFTAHKKEVVSA